MKTFIALAVLCLALVSKGYNVEHDDIDIGAIISNKESLLSFVECFTDKKPCNKMTQDFKNKLPEVIQEACAKCNPTQKRKLKQFLNGLNEQLPGEYIEFKKKFDTEGKLFAALDVSLADP